MATQRPIHNVAGSEAIRLRSDPNILTVGYGVKLVGGVVQYTLCLQYHVRKKLPAGSLAAAGSWAIPATVEGYPTDVVERARPNRPTEDNGPPTGERGGTQYDPLVGGPSTTVIGGFHNFPRGFGTLGGLCIDNATGRQCAVSNAHVWGTETDLDIIQPWLPIDEYFEGALKIAACGPLAYVLEGTWPSGLTATLTAAAAAAWIAAIASDAEDPSRFGQRTTPVAANARTISESISVVTETFPELPFAGRSYAPTVTWNYARHLEGGATLGATSTEPRPNQHFLTGKRAWSNAKTYNRGQRVNICARVVPSDLTQREHFVVAALFPLSQPDHVVRRVLRPGACQSTPPSDRICFDGFPAPAAAGNPAIFTLRVGSVQFDSDVDSVFESRAPLSPSGTGVALRIPPAELRMFVPPSSKLEISVFLASAGSSVRVRAVSAAGRVVAVRSSTAGQTGLQTLTVSGDEIIAALIDATGEASLVGACYSNALFDSYPPPQTYTGSFDLTAEEALGTWGVALFVQSIDDTPLPVAAQNPIAAAQVLGGITESSNVAELGGCALVMLLDHTFEVF